MLNFEQIFNFNQNQQSRDISRSKNWMQNCFLLQRYIRNETNSFSYSIILFFWHINHRDIQYNFWYANICIVVHQIFYPQTFAVWWRNHNFKKPWQRYIRNQTKKDELPWAFLSRLERCLKVSVIGRNQHSVYSTNPPIHLIPNQCPITKVVFQGSLLLVIPVASETNNANLENLIKEKVIFQIELTSTIIIKEW